MIYEFSEKGVEAEKFRQRLENMTPEEKEAYEERIANLPEENIAMEILQDLASEWRYSRGYSFIYF